MHPLPKGITGFDAPEYGVTAEQFTSACHSAVRQVGGRVLQVQPAYDQVTLNFHQAFVALPHGQEIIRVLCNAHYPMVAFARPPAYEGDARLEFLDCQKLADALSVEFSVIGSKDACLGIDSELIAELTEVELDQMRYRKTQRIGDVIFNHWD